MADDLADPLRRLQILQRDLVALADSSLQNLERLGLQLDSSVGDLKRLLERNRKNNNSRKALVFDTNPQPSTITVDDVQYQITEQFRESALRVADQLDLDEIEAAKLCLEVQQPDDAGQDHIALGMRAVLRYHEWRATLLDCMRMLLKLSRSSESPEDIVDAMRSTVQGIIGNDRGEQQEYAAYWRKCVDGLVSIEEYLKRVADAKDTWMVTGQGSSGHDNDYLVAQRLLLTQQHESMAAILSLLIDEGYAEAQGFKLIVQNAASLETAFDITIHYLPTLCFGAEKFASVAQSSEATLQEIHRLFIGQGGHEWRQVPFKAAAMVCWLSEYNATLIATSNNSSQNETDRQRDEEARSKLFFDAMRNEAFQFMLAAAAALKPVVWHDPARTSIINYLTGSALVMPSDAPRPSEEFSVFAMTALQSFTEGFIDNMHEALRALRADEEDKRRLMLSSMDTSPQHDLNMERFMAIMACAYQDDPEAAEHFWSDRGGNLHGFLRWASSRLTTPGVSAFCLLLRSMASDDKSASHVHRFLLEDTTPVSGKLRKTSAISWALIQKELDLYASSIKDQVSAPGQVPAQARSSGELYYEGEDTAIMLDAYLGLTAWISRKSAEARNWLLSSQQSFHIGETMFQLAKSAHTTRLQACCLDVLSALLTEKTLEVRNGVWVALDTWISSGGLDGQSAPRAPNRLQYSPKHYLQMYANSADSATSMVGLLNALIAPTTKLTSDLSIDSLPFPETLGLPHRHAGIDAYVDFVLGNIFAHKLFEMQQNWEINLTNVLRYECLHFALQCLSSFDEDLMLLANTTNVAVESTIETKSLATYARLHPFARVMEWLFNRDVLASLFATLQQNSDALNTADLESPLVQGTLTSLQVLNLAWKLQPTYLDLVRPVVSSQPSKAPPVSSTWPSIDEMLLTHLSAISDIAQFTASKHLEISLQCVSLLQRIGSSRRVSQSGGGQRSRVVSILDPLSGPLTLQLSAYFRLDPWDLECDETPTKIVKADAVLQLLNASLDASGGRSCMAHCLLGLHCHDRNVEVLPHSAFANAESLLHAIIECAATSPVITPVGYTSWLLSLKRRCLELILKLVVSPVTGRIVQTQLEQMDFLAALSINMAPTPINLPWDGKPLQDDAVLFGTSAFAVRDFMHLRESYFELYGTFLRAAANSGSFSIRDRLMRALLGTVQIGQDEETTTASVFDLFDFFDLDTPVASIVPRTTFFDDVSLSSCVKEDEAAGAAFDVNMAEKLLILRKRELREKGTIKDGAEHEAADGEIRSILFALRSQNNFAAVQNARLDALEAWTDLLSLIITKGGSENLAELAQQGLLVVLPKFEKALSENLDAVALLAKLTLTLTHAISPASKDPSEQTASLTIDRLLSTFRVSLKVVTDSDSDLALRDVSYRTCCAVLASIPRAHTNSRTKSAASTRQLLQLVQNAGERLFTVVTEDAFSGRGVTRVSALLLLDSLIALYQSLKINTAMLKNLTKLNFVPVLIDSSIGHVVAAFKGEDDMVATLAYFHTALALLLRLCQTTDGTQLVLNSGLFPAIDESKLFSTDPDIGLDIDNPVALQEFYAILADMLRLVTAAVVQKGIQPGKDFLSRNRLTVQAIFKQASRGHALNVADELGKLILATGYLEDDQAVGRSGLTNDFS